MGIENMTYKKKFSNGIIQGQIFLLGKSTESWWRIKSLFTLNKVKSCRQVQRQPSIYILMTQEPAIRGRTDIAQSQAMTYLPTSALPKVKVGKTTCGWERGPHEEFVLNEYSRSYLEKQQLAACHLSKLKFSPQIISNGDEEWHKYLTPCATTY